MKNVTIWNGLLAVAAVLLAAPVLAADKVPAAEPVKGLVRSIKVLPDKAPDCSSLKSIVETVTRGCETNDERAIAIYNFMRLTHYHRAYPSEPGGIPVLKEINCYGWSLCGGLHAEQSALWRAMGWDWRFVGWPGHTTVEAFYDGRWHYLDVFLKFYAWMPDPTGRNPSRRTIAGQDDLAANPRELILDAFLQATVQNNPFALPYLSPGRNTVTVSVADPAALGENKLVVTYAYRTGARRKSYEQLCLEGKEIARAHDASWNETPTVVQKTFTARDLPAKFTIDVPTPRGLHPVYPRMLFVRRELLAPNQQPLPLRGGAQRPTTKPGDQLKTLPNPLLTGTQPPPKRPVRPVKTVTIRLPVGHFVNKSGEVPTSDFLKWPKSNRETVPSLVYLIGGELPDLPPLKDLAAARLVFPVTRAHPKAPTKVGVVALRAPPTKEQSYDFNKLGDVGGTVIVPILADDAPSWSPPKEFNLDVTRYLRSLLIGEAKHHGFGLRVIPDRGVDDGWTVRVHLPKKPTIRLEIDTYVGAEKSE